MRRLMLFALPMALATGILAYSTRPAWARQIYFTGLHLAGRTEGCNFEQASDPFGPVIASEARRLNSASSILEKDGPLVLWRTPERDMWAARSTDILYFLARMNVGVYDPPNNPVQAGDVVLDGGANVGAFVHHALRSGAAKVVAIEPSPVNVECLRRTYRGEIASGRVVVVPKAIWNETGGTLQMRTFAHSGFDTVVADNVVGKGDFESIDVPMTTIDAIVADLGLERVDFIKMDIEGAERKALRGAVETIQEHRPQMAVATENLPDDIHVLPQVIAEIEPSYRQTNGGCVADITKTWLRPLAISLSPSRRPGRGRGAPGGTRPAERDRLGRT